jgi:hypothetical protein
MSKKETAFPVRPGLKIKAGRQSGVSVVRYELKDLRRKNGQSRKQNT